MIQTYLQSQRRLSRRHAAKISQADAAPDRNRTHRNRKHKHNGDDDDDPGDDASDVGCVGHHTQSNHARALNTAAHSRRSITSPEAED